MNSLLILVGLILRLVHLNQSLWLDESIEALALMGRHGPLLQYALADYQPPLYHFLGYGLTQVLGYSEIVFRLPSLLSGVAVIYFVVKIGVMLAGRKAGLIAGLLAATNPLLIYYSQEGRTYMLTAFLATASVYYLIKLLQSKESAGLTTVFLYFLFSATMVWTSYLSWFLLLALAIYSLAVKRYDILKIQIASALTLILWLPSFLGSLQVGQYTLSLSSQWGDVVGGLTWKSLPLTWVKFVIGRISFNNKIIYGLIVAAIFAVHAVALRRFDRRKGELLLVWLIPPVMLGVLTATILPVYSYFRVLFVLPAYLLILALSLSSYRRHIAASLVIAVQFLCLIYFWVTPGLHREDWRSLALDLSRHDFPIAMPSRDQNPGLLVYAIDENRIFEPKREPITGSPVYYVRYAEDLFDVTRQGQANFLMAGYTLTGQKVYTGIAVDIYEKQ